LRRARVNRCFRGKAISITHSEYVSVAVVIQYAMRMRHIVVCGVAGSTIFYHVISYMAKFRKKSY